jgi:hypothetical protein
MIFMCEFMHLAHIANKTRMDHGNVMIISILRVNVMIKDVLPIDLYIKPRTSNPNIKKSKYGDMVVCDDWLAFLCWAKHNLKKRRSLWYSNGRIKLKLNMASRDFTIDT